MPSKQVNSSADSEPSPPGGEDGPVLSKRSDADEHRALLILLYEKHRRSLFRHLTQLLPSRDDALDLMQESYCRVMTHSNVSRIEGAARNYLFQTATNLARDYFRRRSSHFVTQHVDITDVDISSDAPSAESELALSETLASMRSCIRQMPPLTRRIFLLSRLRRKTYPQIAEQLGIGNRTVERRMMAAIEALTACMNSRGGDIDSV